MRLKLGFGRAEAIIIPACEIEILHDATRISLLFESALAKHSVKESRRFLEVFADRFCSSGNVNGVEGSVSAEEGIVEEFADRSPSKANTLSCRLCLFGFTLCLSFTASMALP